MGNLWLLGTLPLGLIGLVGVALLTWRLVQMHGADLVASVPLAAEQELALEASGPILLSGEGPRFTTAFGKLDYRLTDLADGREVPLSAILFKSSSAGFATVRLSLRQFELGRPGRYRLTVLGLSGADLDPRHRIVFSRDRRGTLVLTIVGLVFSGIALVVGLILSLVVLLGRAQPPV